MCVCVSEHTDFNSQLHMNFRQCILSVSRHAAYKHTNTFPCTHTHVDDAIAACRCVVLLSNKEWRLLFNLSTLDSSFVVYLYKSPVWVALKILLNINIYIYIYLLFDSGHFSRVPYLIVNWRHSGTQAISFSTPSTCHATSIVWIMRVKTYFM